jgi:putative transposase
MAAKRYSPETIIRKLREAEVLQGQGKTIAQVVKKLGITEQTFYRWRKEYGGMRVNQAKRMKELEAENARLKRAVADLTVDNQILKEVTEGKF